MTDPNTVMHHWCIFRGTQGGTIHDALREFATLPMADMDRFCSILAANTRTISDIHHVRDFMHARTAAAGLVIS